MSLLMSTLKHVVKSSAGEPVGAPAEAREAPNAFDAIGSALPGMDAGNPLLEYFMRNGGHVIHKWVDYFDVYHRAFAPYRGRPIKFLEIGIQNGGSARMWREYFGPAATIIGVDVDPACKALEEEGFEVWIGDQADTAFWGDFTSVHGELDIVLDDGGHTMAQQIVTFEALFPRLRDRGSYLCEDTHTSYFPSHGGGRDRPGTFLQYVKGLIDEMHAWYHAPVAQLGSQAYLAQHLYSIGVYDSIVLFEKRRRSPPLALARGSVNEVTEVPPAMSYLDMRRVHGIPD
jgi:hypothetical protein